MDWGLTLLLHPEGIGGLTVEVCGVLPFLLSTAEQTEATCCALGSLVCFLQQEPGILCHSGLVGGEAV